MGENLHIPYSQQELTVFIGGVQLLVLVNSLSVRVWTTGAGNGLSSSWQRHYRDTFLFKTSWQTSSRSKERICRSSMTIFPSIMTVSTLLPDAAYTRRSWL